MRRFTREVLDVEQLRFVIVGGVNTAIGYAIFVLLVLVASDWTDYRVLVVAAYLISSVIGYSLHRRFTFRVPNASVRSLGSFVGVNLGALGANLVLITIFVEALGARVLLGQALALGGTVAISYLGHRFVSFRRTSIPTD